MECPKCSKKNSKVVDSRYRPKSRYRRRVCQDCNHRYSTTELLGNHKAEDLPLLAPDIIGRDHNVDKFEEGRLRNSITKACDRLEIDSEKIETAVINVSEQVSEAAEMVRIDRLIDLVIDELVKLNPLAATRYMSQHKDIKSIKQLIRQVSKFDK